MNEAIIADANLFSYTFGILTSRMEEGFAKQNQMDMALIVPATVNGAFACELYMKSMLSSIPNEHKLDNLFNLLDSDVQTFISKIMVDVGKAKNASYNGAKFMNELAQYGRSFQEWRYFYEYDPNIDINFIKNLVAALKGVVEARLKGIDFSSVDFGFLSP